MAGERVTAQRWARESHCDDVIAGREVISFAPGRDGKVSVPVEQLEGLLFEAGYTPATSDEERPVGA